MLVTAIVGSVAAQSESPEAGGYTIGIVEQQLANPFFGALGNAAKAEAEAERPRGHHGRVRRRPATPLPR